MNVNVTKIQRLSNGIVQFYNGLDIVDSFSITSSVSIGFESNLAKTIIFSNSVKTLSFNVFNIIALYGSTSNKIYSAGIDPSDTSEAYVNRLYDIYGFLISDVIQGCCPGPTFVGGVVAVYPNFASFPATGQQSVIYIDESTNQAYFWDGSSYQLLTSTGVETYPNFASFPAIGMANIIYVDLSVPESYVWDGSVYVSLDGGSVAWGSIIGTLSTQTDLQNALNAKQATLVSGTNIKTVNSTSLLGAGDLSVGTVTSVGVTAGTGISVSGSPITLSGSITVTNSAPDQVVALTAGTGIGVAGTYPNFTITNSSPSSGGTVTSVGLTMPSAFNVASSPVTTSGTLAVTGAGTVSQYVRGDGSLANFPASSGGGASLTYYLNGSVSQGTFGGIAMKEMDRVPVLGAGTDFTIATNGYIQSFITDANVPNLLEIPAGNWNFETYFSASSGGGTPSFYVELYKWNGVTLSLIASGSANPESITNGTAIDLYVSALAVPQTTLVATDRLAVRIWVNNSGRTITLHTENSHLCEVITTFSTGLTALNGLTAQVQNFATGTTGTDFGISSATSTHTFNLPTASAANRGALSSADWTTFNNKQAALVSGTNIKTVNGTTLLGSGDLVIPVFQLQGTNFLSVLANGTPAQNGQAVRDAYTAAQAMTPNGAAKSTNNRVVILLAPGYYTFSEATLGAFTVNQSFIDFESLSGVTDVYFSSMQVTSPFPGINVRISGIDTTKNNYYGHAAFAVASTGDPSENIYIKNCVGGTYSFCAFSFAFSGTIENCVAGNYSFLYGTTATPPAGIVSSGSGSISLYGTFKNCTSGSNSFVRLDGVGYVISYGTIDNCTAGGGGGSFLSGGTMYTSNYGTISNCFSTGNNNFCTGTNVENASRIVNCTSEGGYSFVVTANVSGGVINGGLISNCECSGLDPSFVIKATATYTGSNLNGRIINCTALNSDAAFCGDLGTNSGLISNCIAWQQAFCCNNAAGLTRDILRCTMIYDTFTSGLTSGGRVVLGIDTTGVVNY